MARIPDHYYVLIGTTPQRVDPWRYVHPHADQGRVRFIVAQFCPGIRRASGEMGCYRVPIRVNQRHGSPRPPGAGWLMVDTLDEARIIGWHYADLRPALTRARSCFGIISFPPKQDPWGLPLEDSP